MILTLLRQEYSRLVKAYLESTKEEREKSPSISDESCTSRLIQLFKWLASKGKELVQIPQQEILHEKLLGKHSKDAMPQGGFAEGIAAHTGLGGAR